MTIKVEKLAEVTEQEWKSIHPFNREITQEFLAQQHLSNKTLVQYQSGVRQFFKWVHDNAGNKPLYELKPRDALRYQNFLMSRDLSSNSVKLKRSTVSSLCGYLELYYSDEYPLFRNIYNKQIPNPPKAFRREKRPLTVEELDFLIAELEKREQWQMIAWIQFSYDSGCRRAESRQLLKSVVDHEYIKDPKSGEVQNYYLTHDIRCKGRSKIGKIRKLFFSDISKSAIEKWLEVRGDDDCPYVFVRKTADGKVNQLNETTFNYWCSETFTKIMGFRVHPHQLRSSRATNAVVYENKDIEKVKNLLGHASSEVTKIYVIKEGEDDIGDLF